MNAECAELCYATDDGTWGKAKKVVAVQRVCSELVSEIPC
jgi:hypothetical protein